MLLDTPPLEEIDRAAAPPVDGSARVVLWTAGALLVAVHVWTWAHLPDKGPIILHDEGGYLGNATFLAHGYGRPLDGYYGGYSLLLVPAAYLTSSAHAFYEAALLTNTLLSLATAVLAFLLARQLFPSIRPAAAGLVAAAVVLQPFVFAVAHVAMSENALIPVTLLASLMLAKYAQTQDVRLGIAAGVVASFAFWMSPRGSLVVVAFVSALAVAWLRSRARFAELLGVACASAASAAIGYVFNVALRGDLKTPGLEGSDPVLPLTRASTWRDFIALAGGRLGYLGVATFGLAFVGVCVAAAWAVRGDASPASHRLSPLAMTGTFAAASMLLPVALSSITMRVTRIDVLYYGRYVEGVAMPLVVIGAGWFATEPRRRRPGSVVRIAIGVLGAVAALAGLARLYPKPPAAWTEGSINVLAVFAIRDLTDVQGYSAVLLVGGLVAAAVLLLALVDARAPLVAVVAASLFGAYAVYDSYQRPFSEVRTHAANVAGSLERVFRLGGTTRCVSYDQDTLDGWMLGNDVFLLPQWKFELRRPGTRSQCRALAVTTRRPQEPGDWHVLARDKFYFLRTELWADLDKLPVVVRQHLDAVTTVTEP